MYMYTGAQIRSMVITRDNAIGSTRIKVHVWDRMRHNSQTYRGNPFWIATGKHSTELHREGSTMPPKKKKGVKKKKKKAAGARFSTSLSHGTLVSCGTCIACVGTVSSIFTLVMLVKWITQKPGMRTFLCEVSTHSNKVLLFDTDGELTLEDKYKKTVEEIEALKDHLGEPSPLLHS